MDDTGSHLRDGDASLVHAFFIFRGHLLRRSDRQVGVRDMSGVVDSETQSNDKLQDDDVVHREVPIVDQTKQEDINEQDCKDYKQSHLSRASNEEHD